MNNLKIPSYDDFWWDTSDPEERQNVILKGQIIPLLLFVKENVPFYKEHYKNITEEEIKSIGSMEEFIKRIPYITKEHLSKNNMWDFVPLINQGEIDKNKGRFWIYGTGGTTGKPVSAIHSMEDWRGMALTANRHIEFDFYEDPTISKKFNFAKGTVNSELKCRKTPLVGAKIFGAYNADHITNNIYSSMLVGLGSEFVGRVSTKPNTSDNYQFIQDLSKGKFKINGILAPPEDTENQTKGLTLSNFLKIDSLNSTKDGWKLSHRHNPHFKFIFWSSMPISQDLLDHLQNDRMIPYIKGHFGSTEICPTAATCSENQRSFHLTYGASLVLIKSLEKEGLADPDELGYMIISKVGAVNKNRENVYPSGMILINYMTGDAARLSKDGIKCKCGRNTPILYDVQRIEFHKGKQIFGCQID